MKERQYILAMTEKYFDGEEGLARNRAVRIQNSR